MGGLRGWLFNRGYKEGAVDQQIDKVRSLDRLARQIELLAILQKSLDRAIFLYNFIREVRLSGVRASIAIVHIRKFYRI